MPQKKQLTRAVKMKKNGPQKGSRRRRKGSSKSSTSFQPPKKRVLLKWINIYSAIVNSKFYAYGFQVNGCYQPDSSVSVYTPGFSEIAAFYARYRPTRFRARIQFVNQSQEATGTATVPMEGIAFFSDTQIALSGGSAVDILFNSALPMNKARTVQLASGNGGPAVATIVLPWRTMKNLWGESPYISDNYSSATNTVPARGGFLNVGVYFPAGASAINAWDIKVELEMDTEFTEYIDSLTSIDEDTGKISFYSSKFRTCAACYALREMEFQEDPVCACSNVVSCGNCTAVFPCSSALRSPKCTLHSFKLPSSSAQEMIQRLPEKSCASVPETTQKPGERCSESRLVEDVGRSSSSAKVSRLLPFFKGA